MTSVRIQLSPAQHKLFECQIEAGALLGDCEVQHGLTLVLNDYEGANAMLNRFYSVRTKSTKEWRSWASVIDRINAGIVASAKADGL
jgi:hypothetical protein